MNKQTKKLISKLQERLMILMVRSKEINDAHYLHYADLIEQLKQIPLEEVADPNNINLTQTMNFIRQKMIEKGITEFRLDTILTSEGKTKYSFLLTREEFEKNNPADSVKEIIISKVEENSVSV